MTVMGSLMRMAGMARMTMMAMVSTGMMTMVTVMCIITAGMSDMTLGVHSDFGMMNHCCSVTRWASGNTKAYYT